MVLILLMSGTGGWFTTKIRLRSYVGHAGGVGEGARVGLAGVDIGNVTSVRMVNGKPLTPVEVSMKVNTKYAFNLRKDSVTVLSTAGILGETYVDIDSTRAKGPEAVDGDTLEARDQPDIQDVVRASQGTLQNMDALLKRVDRILAFVQSGQGSIDEAYKKVIAAVDKVKLLIDELQEGKGTAGKLLKDSELYDNANKTIANVRQMTDDINAGKGAIGKMTRDQEFANRLQETINNLAALSARLEKGEGTAGMLFTHPPLYNNSNQMLVETRQLVKAIREDPKKYLTFHVKVF